MSVIDARGYTYDNVQGGRVKYDLLTNALYPAGTPSTTFKHKGPAPELIKIALATGTESIFFGAAPTYTPIYFDSTALQDVYGDQIFFNNSDQRNFVWLEESISEPCLTEMKDFTKNPSYIETKYVQLVDNGPLVDMLDNGPDLPYVSGFGVDQIFDLSPLSDDRWNKNAYIGNAFALPEYYDFPYSAEIYFDTANPFHWKIKDFHYRYYEEQADALTNIGFAKLTYDDFGYGIECFDAGMIYNTSTAAYGEWEFGFYSGDGTTIQNQFIANGNNSSVFNNTGYIFYVGTSEQLWFRVTDGLGGVATPVRTVNGYITPNTYYEIKITRNSVIDEYVTGGVGTFAFYIKGGDFGTSYVLIDVTGGLGTNPYTDNTYTTSSHISIQRDVNGVDKIRDYTINGTLQDFNDFTQSTGTYEIDNLKSSDELLLYQEGKGLDCVSNGVTSISSTTAYGEWEFSFTKSSDGNQIYIPFISDGTLPNVQNTGYILFVSNMQAIWLRTTGGTIVFSTASGYISSGVNYVLKITRNSVVDEFVVGAIGTFAVYIKGGSFGDTYTLVDVTGGSGTNPITDNTYTTSAYTVLDLGAGDNIANYSINGTLLDTRDFTQTTGEYVVTSELEDPELTQIKSYVGILPDYYGSNLTPEGNFSNPADWTNISDWTFDGTDACYGGLVDGGGMRRVYSGLLVLGDTLKIEFDLDTIGEVSVNTYTGAQFSDTTTRGIYNAGHVELIRDVNTSADGIRVIGFTSNGSFCMDNLSIKKLMTKYYKNEE